MRSRFVSNILLAAIGGGLVAISLAFAPASIGWLAFGAGCAAVVITGLAFLARGRGPIQRSLDLVVVIVGGWMIIASLTFAGVQLRWLSFAGASAVCALAIAGLAAHEALIERAVRRDRRHLGAGDGSAPQDFDLSLAARTPAGRR